MFPDGILYDKKDGDYLTQKINTVFSWRSSLARILEKNKSGQTGIETDLSALVERTGIEPVIPP